MSNHHPTMGGKNKGGGWITYQPVDYDVENTVNEIKAQMDTANVAEKAKGVTHTQQTVLKKLAEEQKKFSLDIHGMMKGADKEYKVPVDIHPMHNNHVTTDPIHTLVKGRSMSASKFMSGSFKTSVLQDEEGVQTFVGFSDFSQIPKIPVDHHAQYKRLVMLLPEAGTHVLHERIENGAVSALQILQVFARMSQKLNFRVALIGLITGYRELSDDESRAKFQHIPIPVPPVRSTGPAAAASSAAPAADDAAMSDSPDTQNNGPYKVWVNCKQMEKLGIIFKAPGVGHKTVKAGFPAVCKAHRAECHIDAPAIHSTSVFAKTSTVATVYCNYVKVHVDCHSNGQATTEYIMATEFIVECVATTSDTASVSKFVFRHARLLQTQLKSLLSTMDQKAAFTSFTKYLLENHTDTRMPLKDRQNVAIRQAQAAIHADGDMKKFAEHMTQSAYESRVDDSSNTSAGHPLNNKSEEGGQLSTFSLRF